MEACPFAESEMVQLGLRPQQRMQNTPFYLIITAAVSLAVRHGVILGFVQKMLQLANCHAGWSDHHSNKTASTCLLAQYLASDTPTAPS
jgi:hypothetical protein